MPAVQKLGSTPGIRECFSPQEDGLPTLAHGGASMDIQLCALFGRGSLEQSFYQLTTRQAGEEGNR